jgi:hypothetical protein
VHGAPPPLQRHQNFDRIAARCFLRRPLCGKHVLPCRGNSLVKQQRPNRILQKGYA